jgi:predicted CXXCH cytochrome family protein
MRRLKHLPVLLFLAVAAGQDIDILVTPHTRKVFSFADQIEDDGERKAFLALYQEKRPAERLRLAEAYLSSYPASWLLAQIYEIAAKAAMDVGQDERSMAFAQESLQLLPENPLLLAPLATLQWKAGHGTEARRSAQDALEYLDRFAGPASVSEREWPRIERDLRHSCYRLLGNISAAGALRSSGIERKRQLERAAAELKLAGDDGDVQYQLGLTYLALADPRSATLYFAAAWRKGGSAAEKSLSHLRKIHALSPGASFENFLAAIPEPPAEAAPRAALGSPGEYAGSEACRPCHSGQHAAWSMTGMARMLRAYRPENVMGDFGGRTFEDETGAVVARMWTEKDRCYFATRRPNGEWDRFPVEFTIGSKWQQAYATRLHNGEIHVFPVQYSRIERRWLNYWRMIDPPGSERADVRGFYRLTPLTAYQTNCAPCHTSRLRGHGLEPAKLEFAEAGVNCEMCHGPSARHVIEMRNGDRQQRDAYQAPVDFRRIGHRESVAICSQCHMQSALREPGDGGEWNYASTGPSFYRKYSSRPYVEFSRAAVYKDGRFRETTFISEALMRSACYRNGEASCTSCHDPHPADAAANPASLKFRDRPDDMCLQCHREYAARIAAHTHHDPASDASRCMSCHMPAFMNALLFRARTHQIDDIPRAAGVERFGPSESPNACLMCHKDRDLAWLRRQLRSW